MNCQRMVADKNLILVKDVVIFLSGILDPTKEAHCILTLIEIAFHDVKAEIIHRVKILLNTLCVHGKSSFLS